MKLYIKEYVFTTPNIWFYECPPPYSQYPNRLSHKNQCFLLSGLYKSELSKFRSLRPSLTDVTQPFKSRKLRQMLLKLLYIKLSCNNENAPFWIIKKKLFKRSFFFCANFARKQLADQQSGPNDPSTLLAGPPSEINSFRRVTSITRNNGTIVKWPRVG